jgi:hypothetical protein
MQKINQLFRYNLLVVHSFSKNLRIYAVVVKYETRMSRVKGNISFQLDMGSGGDDP